MITLALDTCLGACSVAVVHDDRTLASACEPMTRGHQERLAPMAREVMAAAGLSFAALDRIGVTVGPGSFTGLRVGLAFAKGLALALDVPCIGIGSLEALAASVAAGGAVVAVIDGGRGNVYRQQFDGGRVVGAPDVVPLETAAAGLPAGRAWGEVTLIGPSAAVMTAIAAAARHTVMVSPDPAIIAKLAAAAPITPPRPLYLRPPDATPKTS